VINVLVDIIKLRMINAKVVDMLIYMREGVIYAQIMIQITKMENAGVILGIPLLIIQFVFLVLKVAPDVYSIIKQII